VSPTFTLSLGFRTEFSTGWNEAYGKASNYNFHKWGDHTLPTIGDSRLRAIKRQESSAAVGLITPFVKL